MGQVGRGESLLFEYVPPEIPSPTCTHTHTDPCTHRNTQVDTGTHRHAGMQAKAGSPRDSCAHTSTRVNTRTDSRTFGNVCTGPTPPPPHTNPHLNTWAPDAGPLGHAELHAGPRTRSSETRAHPSTWTRGYTHPGACRHAHPHPQKYHPTPPRSWSHLTTPAPAAYRTRAPDAHARARTPAPPALARHTSTREPLGSPHCPTVSPHHPHRRAHLFRGRPWAAPRARPQEGPRAPAAHPEAAPAAQLGASCSASSFWGGKAGIEEVGSGRRGGLGGPRGS